VSGGNDWAAVRIPYSGPCDTVRRAYPCRKRRSASRVSCSACLVTRATPESFRQACRKFIYTENLLPEAQVSTAEEGPSTKALQPPSAAIPLLNKAIMQMETEDGWVGLGAVGQRLANVASDFDPRTYGYRKLSDLVRKTGAFDIDQPEGRAMRIRANPKPPSKTRAKATAAR
jgi:hypothetical protein